MVDDRDLGRFAVSVRTVACCRGAQKAARAPRDRLCDPCALLQNLLGLAIAVLFIGYNYVTAKVSA